jgi:hypothetical protein
MPVSHKNYLSKDILELKEYAGNARKHSEKQIKLLADYIKSTGFIDPIVIDEENTILAGHGRLLALKTLNTSRVDCVQVYGLTNAEKKAYCLADNKLGELSTWDIDMLEQEAAAILHEDLDFDFSSLGFEAEEIEHLRSLIDDDSTTKVSFEDDDELLKDDELSKQQTKDEKYTKKIEAPIYEPKGEKPNLKDIYDLTKTNQLFDGIHRAEGISEDEKRFLQLAAYRHTVFNYELIAEYYAHANKEMQHEMEKSALVIIDFDKAIENGFVKMTEEIADAYRDDKALDDDEDELDNESDNELDSEDDIDV